MRILPKPSPWGVNIGPLVQAINSHSAVAYVAAGASMSAGLPNWNDLLSECLKFVMDKQKQDSPDFKVAERLLNDRDFLTTAEWLQRKFGPDVQEYLQKTFRNGALKPSPVHRAIARLPFSLSITTNFEALLERAYLEHNSIQPEVYTYRDSGDVLAHVRSQNFAVIKMHGDIDKPETLVLTRMQVNSLIHKNKTFNECVKTLLLQKSFLFVGSSLRDHDLLHLIDEARLIAGEQHFGPHYAVLFSDEFDAAYAAYLYEAYRIQAILLDRTEGVRDSHTRSVCRFLRDLSGRVAAIPQVALRVAELESPPYSLLDTSQLILHEAIDRTGSSGGVIGFVRDFSYMPLYKMGDLKHKKTARPDPLTRADRLNCYMNDNQILPDTLLGKLFLQGGGQIRYIYASDIQNTDYVANFDFSRLPRYKSSDPETRSLLACQIQADGQNVGVLAMESRTPDAFTESHLDALMQAARTAGVAFTEYQQRRKSCLRVTPFISQIPSFHFLMNFTQELRNLKMLYLLYSIDYGNGLIEGHYDRSRIKRSPAVGDKFIYEFGNKSFACNLLNTRVEDFVDNAQINDQSKLCKHGIDFFKIKGSVYGTPIRVDGYTAAILVCWSEIAALGVGEQRSRILRLAHVIANSPDRDEVKPIEERKSYRYINKLRIDIGNVLGNEQWASAELGNKKYRLELIKTLMQSLTEEPCGISRVRLWCRETKGSKNEFICAYSYTTPEATFENKIPENKYKGFTSDEKNPYTKHVMTKGIQHPFAFYEHRTTFNKQDKNCKQLHKDPNGSWIVGPIVRDKIFLGFVTADNHIPQPPSHVSSAKLQVIERKCSDPVWSFQRLCIDLVTDLLYDVIS